ncbi:MAG: hypothetical protein ABIO70_09260 [Pseudomonadota bacterium]
MRLTPLLGALVACGAGGSREHTRYLEAMELVARDPEAAWRRCADLATPSLADDCSLSAVEALAGREGEPTAALLARCEGLATRESRDECAFQVGERRDDPAACARAGAFEDDCRIHLLAMSMPHWLPAGAGPASPAVLDALAAETARVGLPRGDQRAASATFRALLDRQPILDRGACEAVAPPWRTACQQTGLALYEDRLNMARDQGALPCPGEALPEPLAHSADPELDAALARRPREIPCAPVAP